MKAKVAKDDEKRRGPESWRIPVAWPVRRWRYFRANWRFGR